MKNTKKLLWVIIPVVIALAAGVLLFLLTSPNVTSLEMGEDGVTLYSGKSGSLHADRVYIAEDGSACIDYTVAARGDEQLYVCFDNVEINGWAMDFYDHFADYYLVPDTGSGTFRIAEADILKSIGITDIYDVRFDTCASPDRDGQNIRTIALTVKDAPAQYSAARVPVVGEQVLVDTDDFVCIAETVETGILYGEEEHYVQIYLENRTDKTQLAEIHLNDVNGLSFASFCEIRLSPGAKACMPLVLSSYDFERFGMPGVDNICLSLEVSDKDHNHAVNYTSFELFFNGYTTDTLPDYIRRTEENETVIVDNDRFTFVIFGAERFDDDNYIVQCYIENKTTDPLSLSTEKSVINGIEVKRNIDGYGLSAHRKMYENMIFFTDASDTNETVEEFLFSLNVTGTDDSGNEYVVVSPDQQLEYRP